MTTCAVLVIKMYFSLAIGQISCVSIVRRAVGFAEFPVKLAFNLGEAQSRLLFAIKYTLR